MIRDLIERMHRKAVCGQGASEYSVVVIVIALAVLVVFLFRDQLMGFIQTTIDTFAGVDHGF